MTQVITITVSGLPELRETLVKSLPAAVRGKALQLALAKAGSPMLQDVKNRAPFDTGRLRSAIYSIRDSLASNNVRESRVITVRHGKKFQKSNRDAFYWRWIELGHGVIEIKKHATGRRRVVKDAKVLGTPRSGFFGKHVRAMPARPFMRPAFEANKFKAVEIFKDSMHDAIFKAAAQASKRASAARRRFFLT